MQYVLSTALRKRLSRRPEAVLVWDAPNRKSVGLATPPNRADTCRLRATVGLAPSLSSLGLHAQLLSLAVRTASDKSWASWASLSLGTRLFAHGGIFCRARIVWYRQWRRHVFTIGGGGGGGGASQWRSLRTLHRGA